MLCSETWQPDLDILSGLLITFDIVRKTTVDHGRRMHSFTEPGGDDLAGFLGHAAKFTGRGMLSNFLTGSFNFTR